MACSIRNFRSCLCIEPESVLAQVSAQLTAEFGKWFDASNLYKMSQFYRAFPNLDALRLNLSWTHYRLLRCHQIQTGST
ncbi:MAG: DUF1016 N-terminal domain-containing protein [Pirellula sp.]|nr:DUF1016 N-terminal domain-containing protein [Pirellula sp.]